MEKGLKSFKNKLILLILVFSTLLMLTACGDDEDEMVTTESEITHELVAAISVGESTVGELTDDMEVGTGFKDSEGTDNYDPDNPFKISRDARPIRRIVKQDVYGNILSEDFYFYRNTLSKSEQNLYDQIYANAVDLDPDFNLTTKIHSSKLRDIFDSVRMDNPDLFWLSTAYSYSYDNNDNVTSMTLGFYDMVNNLDSFKNDFYNCADSALEHIMGLDSDIEKVKHVHDLLTNINNYEFGPLDQSAYSGICQGKTVCAGYASAFQYYMQRLGILSATLYGDAGESHAWSMVYLDGDFYEMDVTWNDPIGNPATTYYYDYFNVSSSKMAESRIRNDRSALLPKANGSIYSFSNWYGNDPGRNFDGLNYGKPKTNLPHLYPELDTRSSQNESVNRDLDEEEDSQVDEDDYEEINKNNNMSDRDELEEMISNWSDQDWEDFWDELSEVLTAEELQEVDEMDWDEFIDLMYDMFYE